LGFLLLRRVITIQDAKLLSQKPVYYSTPPWGKAPSAYALPPDEYMTRTAKYIPAEIVAVYLTILGLLAVSSDVSPAFYWFIFGVLLILTVLYAWKAASATGLPAPVAQVAVSTIAFAIWAFALGKPFTFFDWYTPLYASVLLILYTLIPPLLLK